LIALNESLSARLNALGVSRETQSRLEQFAVLFQKWAGTINLVAPSTLHEVWQRHIVDSLQIFALNPKPGNWVDLGSGGGFPGVITAICLAEANDGWVHLIESNNKKAAFLRTALAETGARGSVHPVRIETASKAVKTCDFISARALADLDRLFTYVLPWAESNAEMKAYLHKGRDYESELKISRRRWSFDLVKHRSIVEPDSVILEISRLKSLS